MEISTFTYLRWSCVTGSVLSFRCDSVEKLRQKVDTLESYIAEPKDFKEFYQFTFDFAKNPGQKSLGMVCVSVCVCEIRCLCVR